MSMIFPINEDWKENELWICHGKVPKTYSRSNFRRNHLCGRVAEIQTACQKAKGLLPGSGTVAKS